MSTPLVKEAQGPAASNFFNSPELVACVLETGVFTTDDLFRNLRINKFFNAAIKGNPTVQRIMKLRSVADSKIPTTHVEKHNMITAHLAHFLLNPERFELRPFELVTQYTQLEKGEEVFTLAFHRNNIQSQMLRRGLPLGPMSARQSPGSYDDHGKRVYLVSDRAEQSWENILITPFPIRLDIHFETTYEVEVLCKRCDGHHLKTKQKYTGFRYLKHAGCTLGDLVRFLEIKLDGRKSYARKKC